MSGTNRRTTVTRDAMRGGLRLPPKLVRGSLVRVVSPSYPLLCEAPARRARAERAIQALGYRVSYGANAFRRAAHVAGSPEERADDINCAFADPNVSGIICAAGGGNSNDVLPYLDYELMSRKPKAIIGHSDNASILLAISARAGLVTFHGPSFMIELGEFPVPQPETIACFQAVVQQQDEIVTFRPYESRTNEFPDWEAATERARSLPGGWEWLQPGDATGVLVGGVLGSLTATIGTEWFPTFSPIILFWDALYEDPEEVDGLLGEYHRMGLFQHCRGMVVGIPARQMGGDWNRRHKAVVQKWATWIDGPVVFGGDCGHTDPSWTLPIGAQATLSSTKNEFSVSLAGGL